MMNVGVELSRDHKDRPKRCKDNTYRFSVIVSEDGRPLVKFDGFRVSPMCSRILVPNLVYGTKVIPLSEIDRNMEDSLLRRLRDLIYEGEKDNG